MPSGESSPGDDSPLGDKFRRFSTGLLPKNTQKTQKLTPKKVTVSTLYILTANKHILTEARSVYVVQRRTGDADE